MLKTTQHLRQRLKPADAQDHVAQLRLSARTTSMTSSAEPNCGNLKDLGIGSIGHRRKLLDANALLRAEPTINHRMAELGS
jgi:hypothetical protein